MLWNTAPVRVLHAFGFFWDRKVSLVLTFIFLISHMTTHVLLLINMRQIKVNLTDACTIALIELRAWHGIARAFHILLNRRGIFDLVDFMNNSIDPNNKNFLAMETTIRLRTSRIIRKFCRVVFSYKFFSHIFFLLGFFSGIMKPERYVKGTIYNDQWRPLVYEVWWPWGDIHEFPNYYYMLPLQLLMHFVHNGINTIMDLFLGSLMFLVAEQATFLTNTASRALRSGRRGQVTSSCRAWIRYHQYHLETIRHLNSELGQQILMTYASTACQLMLATFLFRELRHYPGTMIIHSIFVITPVLLHLLVFSMIGQRVINKEASLTSTVLNTVEVSRGELGPCPVRYTLEVLRARCAVARDYINGLGVFTVSMEFFTQTLSAAVSYFVVLIHLKT
ncbi:Odorant receptor 39 [Ephemera danica]|nr:Odorant receptor 39 [Ephemera danica]